MGTGLSRKNKIGPSWTGLSRLRRLPTSCQCGFSVAITVQSAESVGRPRILCRMLRAQDPQSPDPPWDNMIVHLTGRTHRQIHYRWITHLLTRGIHGDCIWSCNLHLIGMSSGVLPSNFGQNEGQLNLQSPCLHSWSIIDRRWSSICLRRDCARI